MENKLRLFAKLNPDEPNKELATALSIPPADKRQPDLQYFTSVFVSSGMNLNSAFFLPSELIKARESVVHKPLDVEHELDKIVGHMYSSAFSYKDGSVFDPVEMFDALGTEIEKMPMDIVMAARLYKAVFPELADEVANGEWKVSMECFFRDYDLIVNNIIIPRLDAESAGYQSAAGKRVKVIEGEKELGTHVVGRVLRDILFSGCGLVKNPANPDSVIIETAQEKKSNDLDSNIILDLTKIDSYMKAKQEKDGLTIHALKTDAESKALVAASYGGLHKHNGSIYMPSEELTSGEHYHMVFPDDLPDGVSLYLGNDGAHTHDHIVDGFASESSHVHDVYITVGDKVEVIKTESVSEHAHDHSMDSFSGGHKHAVVLPDGSKIYTITVEDVMKKITDKEEAAVNIIKQDADGFEQTNGPEICVSFKRYVYDLGQSDNPGEPANADKTPGLVPQVPSYPAPVIPGAFITQDSKVVAENWCAMFDRPCPVPGGLATDKNCLRWGVDEAVSNMVDDRVHRSVNNITAKFDSLVEILRGAEKITK